MESYFNKVKKYHEYKGGGIIIYELKYHSFKKGKMQHKQFRVMRSCAGGYVSARVDGTKVLKVDPDW